MKIDFKRLLMPNAYKIIILILIFIAFYLSLGMSVDGFAIGEPLKFYSGSYFCHIESQCSSSFNIGNFLLDIAFWYGLACLSFYFLVFKINKKDKKSKIILKHIGNVLLGLIFTVLIFFLIMIIIELISITIKGNWSRVGWGF